jgi:uncharacterized damage-inducible protein DinB
MTYNRYRMFSGYNAWANARLYESAAQLSDVDYRANRGAFFKSVHGTLNHMLGADQFWMHRFTGQGVFPAALEAILFDNFEALKVARIAMDERITSFVETLDDAKLTSIISYTPVSNPAPVNALLAPNLDHFFNHQTHHRGQIHALLTGLGLDAPSLDLVRYNREVCGIKNI